MRESYTDKTTILATSVLLLQSACNTGFSYLFSGETFWAIMYYIPCTAALVISLHVFEDDTVAKVTVSKANLNVFCVFVGPCPVFCCFAVLLCGETQIWLGDLRVVFGCGGCVVLVFLVFRDDLPKFLDHTCPCTFLLFTAYAIVRTEPSANRPNRRKKKI